MQTFYPFSDIHAYGPFNSNDYANNFLNSIIRRERANGRGGRFSGQVIDLENPFIPKI